tara:strand:- start:109 stop:414 length:306 start_codon:yes stop_codon:yes gene_type:complete
MKVLLSARNRYVEQASFFRIVGSNWDETIFNPSNDHKRPLKTLRCVKGNKVDAVLVSVKIAGPQCAKPITEAGSISVGMFPGVLDGQFSDPILRPVIKLVR